MSQWIEKWFIVAWNKSSWHFKMIFFFFNFWFSSWSTHLSRFFIFPMCLMPNGHRMVDLGFFGNVSCGYQLCWCSQLVVVNLQWSSTMLLIFKALKFPLQNFLNHHCTVHSSAIPEPNPLLMLWVVSAALQLIFYLIFLNYENIITHL